MTDFGSLQDLRSRLDYIHRDADRRLVTLFGSGISNSVIPSVQNMLSLFRSYIPEGQLATFDQDVSAKTGATAYQTAASFLRRCRGDGVLARAIRIAVLSACVDVTEEERRLTANDIECCRNLQGQGIWKVPAGYHKFAKFLSALPGNLRGPILTTNFDPLLEIALRQAGLESIAVPVGRDSVPTAEQLREQSALPVFHLHGFWTSNSTLNTTSLLAAPRDRITSLLRQTFRKSIVLVLAYAGWQDMFMNCLSDLAHRAEEMDLLEVEILWSSYETDTQAIFANRTLATLVNQPSFVLYLGIDANDLFHSEAGEPNISPYGFTRVTAEMELGAIEPISFVEGRQPTWGDATSSAWPKLAPTRSMQHLATELMDSGGGGGIIAVGPMGEGKSMAIRQVALSLTEKEGWTVLWREPGAPKLDSAWFADAKKNYGKIVVCADEADLIGAELIGSKTAWADDKSGIVLILASQDRLWQTHAWTCGKQFRK